MSRPENCRSNFEKLKCPVCVDLPSDKIYLCVNGHDICGGCITKLSSCPQCRVSYRRGKIRSRRMEEYVQTVKIPCPYEGCEEIGLGKEIKIHSRNCKFNGHWVNLCELIGFPDCDFLMNAMDIVPALEHFQAEHGIMLYNKPHGTCIISNFRERFNSDDIHERVDYGKSIFQISKGKNYAHYFMRFIECHLPANYMYCTMLYLGETSPSNSSKKQQPYVKQEKFRAEFRIFSQSTRVKNLEWSSSPLEIPDLIDDALPFTGRISIPFLSKHFVDMEDRICIKSNLIKFSYKKLNPDLLL